ncbi:hypothetical protein AB0L71_18025 [Streptomyces sp. NPDC052052]|uniref:hypothetical protein n=1 Tax=Streptomyces sp. NPDC052052 TaxID=3154756 RepID=UPI00343A51FA
MTHPPRCITCGTDQGVEPVHETYGCPAHIRGLRGEVGDVLTNLVWLQETRTERMRVRGL